MPPLQQFVLATPLIQEAYTPYTTYAKHIQKCIILHSFFSKVTCWDLGTFWEDAADVRKFKAGYRS